MIFFVKEGSLGITHVDFRLFRNPFEEWKGMVFFGFSDHFARPALMTVFEAYSMAFSLRFSSLGSLSFMNYILVSLSLRAL